MSGLRRHSLVCEAVYRENIGLLRKLVPDHGVIPASKLLNISWVHSSNDRLFGDSELPLEILMGLEVGLVQSSDSLIARYE